ncbi:hypothetical protein SmJEL517_g03626 [Synchytrium microbalum]|uniref:Uncharacterized protein n=1 Tax=Synchytrium microbalum TaxID=1806994 RepID=A0A507C6D0_9FUNG|nr:uncharacterized protein SmJEL517_g03626 [Synchytrium microbalum]TPX33526.1 hypothetical protein SmJEL517_g03626 [Synchytrium microbalum]
MSIAAVAHRHAFGLSARVKSNIHFADEQTVLYPAGANVILYNVETKAQRFIPVGEKRLGVTALAVSQSKRYLAVAERAPALEDVHHGSSVPVAAGSVIGGVNGGANTVPEKEATGPALEIWDLHGLRRRKVMYASEGLSREIITCAFSSDGKLVVACTGAPDYQLFLWGWEKPRLLATTRAIPSVHSKDLPAGGGSRDNKTSNMHHSVTNLGARSPRESFVATRTSMLTGNNGSNANLNSGNNGGTMSDRVGVAEVAFHPKDESVISVVGPGILRLFRYSEGQLKPIATPKVDNKLFSCATWTLTPHLIVGSEDGRILVFSTIGELVFEVTNFHGPNAQPKPVTCLLTTAKGIIAGGTGGAVSVYERADESLAPTNMNTATDETGGADVRKIGMLPSEMKKNNQAAALSSSQMVEVLKKSRELTLPDDGARISNLALGGTDDELVCSTDGGQMYVVVMASAEIKGDEPMFTSLSAPLHSGVITGMDTCIRKPLVVTCSPDKTVRVWNCLEPGSELVKTFPEEAHCVAVHPSGLYVLVGFSDKLRLCNLLIDDVRVFREFGIRGCRECRFSSGGHLFAAVHSNVVQIYSTWTFELIGNLKAHSGKVRSVCWSPDDSRIVTAGQDGAVYEWNLRELLSRHYSSDHTKREEAQKVAGSGVGSGQQEVAMLQDDGAKRESESVTRGCNFTSVAAFWAEGGNSGGCRMYAVASDKTLKEITDSHIVRETTSDVGMTQVAISHSGRMMFVGTSTGTIRSYKHPLDTNDQPDYAEHQAHGSPVTRLQVSYDDTHLFSVAEDGSFYIFKISDREGRSERPRDVLYADEILVTKSDLEEKTMAMQDLRSRVEELMMENEYQLRLKDLNFNDKIREVTEKFTQEIEALKISATVLRTDKEKEEQRHVEELEDEQQRHAREIADIEASHAARLVTEYEKYNSLQGQTIEQRTAWENRMRELREAKDKALRELAESYEQKLRERQAEVDQLQEEHRAHLRNHVLNTRLTEEDIDTELLNLRTKYESRLREERETGLRLKGENGIMRKKFGTLQSEIDSLRAEIARAQAEEKKLQGVIKSLERDIEGLKKEIHERDETLADKERRVSDLKKRNQELDKFKFVLDYKIRELRRQIEPRERDIRGMTQQMKEMDAELEQYHRSNAALELQIADLRLKARAAQKEVEKERERAILGGAIVSRFGADLADAASHIAGEYNAKALKSSIKKLYQKYCAPVTHENASDLPVPKKRHHTKPTTDSDETETEDAQPDEAETEILHELTRQRDFLERTAQILKSQLEKETKSRKRESQKIVVENVALIREINDLRRDLNTGAATEQKVAAAQALKKHSFHPGGVKQHASPKMVTKIPLPGLTAPATIALAASAVIAGLPNLPPLPDVQSESPETGHSDVKVQEVLRSKVATPAQQPIVESHPVERDIVENVVTA